jgi:hypothetical protein
MEVIVCPDLVGLWPAPRPLHQLSVPGSPASYPKPNGTLPTRIGHVPPKSGGWRVQDARAEGQR